GASVSSYSSVARPAASRAAANKRSRTVTATVPSPQIVGADVRARGRNRVEARGIDRITGHFVDAVRAVVESLQRRFDLRQLFFEAFEDREVLLAFEGVRRRIRGVLVVVAQLAALIGLFDVESLAAQAVDQTVHALTLVLEPATHLIRVEVLR